MRFQVGDWCKFISYCYQTDYYNGRTCVVTAVNETDYEVEFAIGDAAVPLTCTERELESE